MQRALVVAAVGVVCSISVGCGPLPNGVTAPQRISKACRVSDDKVQCYNLKALALAYRSAFPKLEASSLARDQQAIERLRVHEKGDDAALDCLGVASSTAKLGDVDEVSTQDQGSTTVLALPKELAISERTRALMIQRCEDAIRSQIQQIAPTRRQYGELVNATKARIDAKVKGCSTSANSTLGFVGPLNQLFKQLRIPFEVAKVQRAKEAFARGMNDAAAGKKPQEQTQDTLGSGTPYGQGYAAAANVLRARCRDGDASACDALKSAGEDPPQPPSSPQPPIPPNPPPETPPPETPPPETPPPTSSDCIDAACPDFCANMKRWWEWFSRECDKSKWESYQCKSYVAGMNGCADPGQVLPTPDGDYVCHRPATAEQIAERASVERCEQQQGVSAQSEQGLICKPPPANLSVEEAYEFRLRNSCLYSYDVEGNCAGGRGLGFD